MNMSFLQGFDEERESIFHFDNGFDNSLIVNLNNSSMLDQSNIFSSKKKEKLNNFNLAKEAKNENNISNTSNFSTPSYFEETLSKNTDNPEYTISPKNTYVNFFKMTQILRI